MQAFFQLESHVRSMKNFFSLFGSEKDVCEISDVCTEQWGKWAWLEKSKGGQTYTINFKC